jgi:rsbT antagonist protein RsbS
MRMQDAARSDQGSQDTAQIPILRLGSILVASIQQALDDGSIVAFQQRLLERVANDQAAGVAIDITAVDVVDSFMARCLNDLAIAVGLLGAKMAVVGIQPAVAVSLVEMGFTIPKATTARDLEQGLKLLGEAPIDTVKTLTER